MPIPAKTFFSKLRISVAAGAMALALSACGGTNWGLPYVASVQQGNWITSEQVAQLRKGMTKDQVRFLLGTPTLQDVLHADRWDYPYVFEPGYGKTEKRNFTVWFENGVLDHWEGDPQPDRQPYEKADTGAKAISGDADKSDDSASGTGPDWKARQEKRQANHPRLQLQTANPPTDPSAGGTGTQPLP